MDNIQKVLKAFIMTKSTLFWALLIPLFILQNAFASNVSRSTIIDEYQLAPGKFAQANQILVAPTGNIFVVGGASDAADKNHWLVRMKTPNSTQWKTVQDLSSPSGYAWADSIASDGNGGLYVAGSFGHSLRVQRSNDEGASWTTISDLPETTNPVATLQIFGGKMYLGDGSDFYHVQMRVSTDQGKTWSSNGIYDHGNLEKDWVSPTGMMYTCGGGISLSSGLDQGIWTDIHTDVGNSSVVGVFTGNPSTGELVAGSSEYPGSQFQTNHWVLRTTADSGKNWKVVDDYVNPTRPEWNQPQTATLDSEGRLIVVGTSGVRVDPGHFHVSCVTRISDANYSNWRTVDELVLPGSCIPYDVKTTPTGEIVTAGDHSLKGNGDSWFTSIQPKP
jgi:hypothetical protein